MIALETRLNSVRNCASAGGAESGTGRMVAVSPALAYSWGGMAKRGASISVKMILTTTLLIVVTGVGAGLLNVMNIRRAFDESAAKQIALFRQSRSQIGELGAPLFAQATEQLILEKGRDKDILTLVESAVREDTRI